MCNSLFPCSPSLWCLDIWNCLYPRHSTCLRRRRLPHAPQISNSKFGCCVGQPVLRALSFTLLNWYQIYLGRIRNWVSFNWAPQVTEWSDAVSTIISHRSRILGASHRWGRQRRAHGPSLGGTMLAVSLPSSMIWDSIPLWNCFEVSWTAPYAKIWQSYLSLIVNFYFLSLPTSA